VIVLPPLAAGTVQVTVAAPEPAVAFTPVGALGVVAGVTGLDWVELPVFTALVASTLKM